MVSLQSVNVAVSLNPLYGTSARHTQTCVLWMTVRGNWLSVQVPSSPGFLLYPLTSPSHLKVIIDGAFQNSRALVYFTARAVHLLLSMRPAANHLHCFASVAMLVAQGGLMSLEFAGLLSPPFHHGPQLLDFRSAHRASVTALRIAGALSVVAVLAGCGGRGAGLPMAPPEVKVIAVAQRDVPIVSEWVATLDGYVNAQIQPQVTGYLLKQTYREGSFVRKDDVLFEIDPRPFEATLDQAKAQLAQSEANASKAARDLERDTPLAEARAIPRSQLDNDVQAHRAAVAAVDAARAQVRIAELNLSFTKVLSLIDGIVGITQVQIGNLVTPTSVLTTVSQIEPIKAYFAISEQEYIGAAEQITAAALGTLPAGARIP